MSHKYYPATSVTSPRDCIDDVQLLFDGGINNGGFTLALVTWEGKKRIGIRWNVTHREWNDVDKASGVKISIGEPNSRGYPTWFILPKALLQALLGTSNEIADTVKEIIDEIEE